MGESASELRDAGNRSWRKNPAGVAHPAWAIPRMSAGAHDCLALPLEGLSSNDASHRSERRKALLGERLSRGAHELANLGPVVEARILPRQLGGARVKTGSTDPGGCGAKAPSNDAAMPEFEADAIVGQLAGDDVVVGAAAGAQRGVLSGLGIGVVHALDNTRLNPGVNSLEVDSSPTLPPCLTSPSS